MKRTTPYSVQRLDLPTRHDRSRRINTNSGGLSKRMDDRYLRAGCNQKRL